MIDFLKAYPSFTMNDYVWGLSAPLIKIMLMDATQVYYLDDKQKEEYKNWKLRQTATCADNLDDVASELGIPKKKKLKK